MRPERPRVWFHRKSKAQPFPAPRARAAVRDRDSKTHRPRVAHFRLWSCSREPLRNRGGVGAVTAGRVHLDSAEHSSPRGALPVCRRERHSPIPPRSAATVGFGERDRREFGSGAEGQPTHGEDHRKCDRHGRFSADLSARHGYSGARPASITVSQAPARAPATDGRRARR